MALTGGSIGGEGAKGGEVLRQEVGEGDEQNGDPKERWDTDSSASQGDTSPENRQEGQGRRSMGGR